MTNMKKCFSLFLVLFIALAISQNSNAGSLDIEYLVDNRIESMGVPTIYRSCVKERTMQRLNEIGSIQTYILDRMIRTIINNAYQYCSNGR